MSKETSKISEPMAENPLLSDSACYCSCGKVSECPLCFECFKKGLERGQRLEKPTGVSNNLVLWVMFVMLVIGLIAAWLGL